MSDETEIFFTPEQEQIRNAHINRKEVILLFGSKDDFNELQLKLNAYGLKRNWRKNEEKSFSTYDELLDDGCPPIGFAIGTGNKGYGLAYNLKIARENCSQRNISLEIVYYKDIKNEIDSYLTITNPPAIMAAISGRDDKVSTRVIFLKDGVKIDNIYLNLKQLKETYERAFGLVRPSDCIKKVCIKDDLSEPEEINVSSISCLEI